MRTDDVNRAPRSALEPEMEAASDERAMRVLRAAAGALQGGGGELQSRIPLEQMERELLRVMHIELASLCVRARDLVLQRRAACDQGHRATVVGGHSAGRDGGRCACRDPLDADVSVLALQCAASESIDVARACGVRVPRIALHLLAGGPATWPCAARFECWARRLDPDVELHAEPFEAETVERRAPAR